MAKELAIQTEIKKSVIAAGGISFKLSNRFTIGVPDLGIWLYPFVPCLVEVKDLGIVTENFDRGIPLTPKQRDTLRRIENAYDPHVTGYTPNRHVTTLFLHVRHRGVARLVCAPWHAERLVHDYDSGAPFGFVDREKGGKWNIRSLLDQAGIAKVKMM